MMIRRLINIGLILVNRSGLGGALSSGEIGVITQCTEVVNNNGIEIPYSQEKARDEFIQYDADSGLTKFLNDPFNLGPIAFPSGWSFIIICLLIIGIGFGIKALVKSKMGSGKASAKADVAGPKGTLSAKPPAE